MSNLQGFSSVFFMKSLNNDAKGGSNTNLHGSRTSEQRIRMEMTIVVAIKQIK